MLQLLQSTPLFRIFMRFHFVDVAFDFHPREFESSDKVKERVFMRGWDPVSFILFNLSHPIWQRVDQLHTYIHLDKDVHKSISQVDQVNSSTHRSLLLTRFCFGILF